MGDARHALARCPAHAAARRVLITKLPWYLHNLQAPYVQNALMGADDLAVLCGSDVARRRAVVEAVKAFRTRVERQREGARRQR